MATRKITITVPEEALERLKQSARTAGLPLSTYITEVTAHHARIQDGLAALRDWDADSGSASAADITWAQEQLARVDALLRGDGAPTSRAG